MPENIMIRTDKRMLKVELTTQELLDAGSKLGKIWEEVREKQDVKKAVNKKMDAEILYLQNQIGELSTCLNKGYRVDEITCDIEIDYDNKTRRVIRTDTREVIEDRTLTIDECQIPLPEEVDLMEVKERLPNMPEIPLEFNAGTDEIAQDIENEEPFPEEPFSPEEMGFEEGKEKK